MSKRWPSPRGCSLLSSLLPTPSLQHSHTSPRRTLTEWTDKSRQLLTTPLLHRNDVRSREVLGQFTAWQAYSLPVCLMSSARTWKTLVLSQDLKLSFSSYILPFQGEITQFLVLPMRVRPTLTLLHTHTHLPIRTQSPFLWNVAPIAFICHKWCVNILV